MSHPHRRVSLATGGPPPCRRGTAVRRELGPRGLQHQQVPDPAGPHAVRSNCLILFSHRRKCQQGVRRSPVYRMDATVPAILAALMDLKVGVAGGVLIVVVAVAVVLLLLTFLLKYLFVSDFHRNVLGKQTWYLQVQWFYVHCLYS